jgi:D-psicose/D-tagatose/L-ribulose 3-epimerase
MKIGFCASVDRSTEVKAWGYDYIELPLAPLCQLSENEFSQARQKLEKSGLPCLAVNVFLPKSLPVVGPNVDDKACAQYARKAIERASLLGAEVIVFGSGNSRNIPAGFPGYRALEQVKTFAALCAKTAAKKSIRLALEPLNATESNVINRVSEALILALAVDEPNFAVLADTYHMLIEKEDFSVIETAGSMLQHVHVSTLLGRKIPLQQDGLLLESLFSALRRAGYSGHVSIEAGFRSDQASEAKEASRLMRSFISS